MNEKLENPNPKIYPKLEDRPLEDSIKNKNPDEYDARDIFGKYSFITF